MVHVRRACRARRFAYSGVSEQDAWACVRAFDLTDRSCDFTNNAHNPDAGLKVGRAFSDIRLALIHSNGCCATHATDAGLLRRDRLPLQLPILWVQSKDEP